MSAGRLLSKKQEPSRVTGRIPALQGGEKSNDLLPTVDVEGRAGEGRVDHDVHGERGDVLRPDDAADAGGAPMLLSVNVGMPKDVSWNGRTVYTGVWKEPVDGPVMVRRLNIDGDGQGDTAGHGGEQRAVLVYQLDSYRRILRPSGWGGAALSVGVDRSVTVQRTTL